MSKTLFWYLFRDLVRVFLLAVIVLAGIMSFGGLLRPLTQKGLDLWQVLQTVFYLMPAMMTYSIPVASLFAATIVYGRLTADNELTACRAAGISYLSMSLPAVAIGLVISVCSLLFLSYVVPYYTLRVERVAYTNIAKYIANEIERSHELRLLKDSPKKIYAQGAYVPPAQQGDVQTVVLIGPTIVDEDKHHPGIPTGFMMARQATLHIRQRPGEQMFLDTDLEGWVTFGREGTGRPAAGAGQQHIAPIPIPSLINENVKFMNIDLLKQQAAFPEKSERVAKTLASFIAREQEDVFLRGVQARLAAEGQVLFQSEHESYEIQARGLRMTLAPIDEKPSSPLQLTVASGPRGGKFAHFVRRQAEGHIDLTADARLMTLRVEADNTDNRLRLMVDLQTPASASNSIPLVQLQIGKDDPQQEQKHAMPSLNIPMPQELQLLRQRTAEQYLSSSYLPLKRPFLERDIIRTRNGAISEMHSRASFALSCLVLVIMGCCMGMIFRSGDFLTAFAVCVMPALATITLVVTGQQFATDLPDTVSSGFRNPLPFALSLIWAGNALIAVIALSVMRRLHRH